MKVSFDFDTTLMFPVEIVDNFPHTGKPNKEFVDKFKEHMANGDEVYIVTSRVNNSLSHKQIIRFCGENRLNPVDIIHTNGESKTPTLKELGIELHYDDDPQELIDAKKAGIEGVNTLNDAAIRAHNEYYGLDESQSFKQFLRFEENKPILKVNANNKNVVILEEKKTFKNTFKMEEKLFESENKACRVGVVGYSDDKFDKKEAKELIEKAFDKVKDEYGDNITVVSGYAAMGIPLLAYKEAVKREWKTKGIACKKADEYEKFPVDSFEIVGDDWGDESETFLNDIDVLIKIGGGEQSKDEAKKAKDMDLKVFEYKLEEKKPVKESRCLLENKKIKVYLDDLRPTPDGWVRVYWPEEAIELLKTGNVEEISLDHDLGDDEHGTGNDVVNWIEEQVVTNGFIPPKIRVHSDNAAGVQKMNAGIKQIERYHRRNLGLQEKRTFKDSF